MSLLTPIHWYHSGADLIWTDALPLRFWNSCLFGPGHATRAGTSKSLLLLNMVGMTYPLYLSDYFLQYRHTNAWTEFWSLFLILHSYHCWIFSGQPFAPSHYAPPPPSCGPSRGPYVPPTTRPPRAPTWPPPCPETNGEENHPFWCRFEMALLPVS